MKNVKKYKEAVKELKAYLKTVSRKKLLTWAIGEYGWEQSKYRILGVGASRIVFKVNGLAVKYQWCTRHYDPMHCKQNREEWDWYQKKLQSRNKKVQAAVKKYCIPLLYKSRDDKFIVVPLAKTLNDTFSRRAEKIVDSLSDNTYDTLNLFDAHGGNVGLYKNRWVFIDFGMGT